MSSKYTKQQMEDLIYEMDEKFKEIGVKFYKSYKCCSNCASTQLEQDGVKNYIFYHEQDEEGLDNGYLWLKHNFDEETTKKVVKLVEENKKNLLWDGNDFRSMFLTSEAKLMKEQIEN